MILQAMNHRIDSLEKAGTLGLTFCSLRIKAPLKPKFKTQNRRDEINHAREASFVREANWISWLIKGVEIAIVASVLQLPGEKGVVEIA